MTFKDFESDYAEVATVGADAKLGLKIKINVDFDYIGSPYFKVFTPYDFNPYMNEQCEGAVARLMFNGGIIIHSGGYPQLEVAGDVVNKVKAFMRKKSKKYIGLTNWQAACYDWNLEYGSLPADTTTRDYISGKYDKKNITNALYVPSTQEMPNNWNGG